MVAHKAKHGAWLGAQIQAPWSLAWDLRKATPRTNQRMSWLLLFLLDYPTQLPKSDLTSQEGQENFEKPRGIWKPKLSRMSIALIQPSRNRTWLLQNCLGRWDVFSVHPKIQREGSKPSHLPEKGSLRRRGWQDEFPKSALYWILGNAPWTLT